MNQEQHDLEISLAKKHAELDMLIKGTYGKQNGTFKACSIGCLCHDLGIASTSDHEAIAERLGQPEWLLRLQDTIFENTDETIHVEIAKAKPVTDNWQPIYHAIMWRILNEVTLPNAGASEDVVRLVMDLHEKHSTDGAAWSAAESAASAAESAAWKTIRLIVLEELRNG